VLAFSEVTLIRDLQTQKKDNVARRVCPSSHQKNDNVARRVCPSSHRKKEQGGKTSTHIEHNKPSASNKVRRDKDEPLAAPDWK